MASGVGGAPQYRAPTAVVSDYFEQSEIFRKNAADWCRDIVKCCEAGIQGIRELAQEERNAALRDTYAREQPNISYHDDLADSGMSRLLWEEERLRYYRDRKQMGEPLPTTDEVRFAPFPGFGQSLAAFAKSIKHMPAVRCHCCQNKHPAEAFRKDITDYQLMPTCQGCRSGDVRIPPGYKICMGSHFSCGRFLPIGGYFQQYDDGKTTLVSEWCEGCCFVLDHKLVVPTTKRDERRDCIESPEWSSESYCEVCQDFKDVKEFYVHPSTGYPHLRCKDHWNPAEPACPGPPRKCIRCFRQYHVGQFRGKTKTCRTCVILRENSKPKK